MRTGFVSDLTGASTKKVVILGETIEFDNETREGIAKAIYADCGSRSIDWEQTLNYEKKPWLDTADQILAYLHKRGKFVLKQMPVEMTRPDGSTYFCEPLTGLILRDKSEIVDITEEG